MAKQRLIKKSLLNKLSRKEKKTIQKYLDREYKSMISENKKLIREYRRLIQSLPKDTPYYPFTLAGLQYAENVRSQAEKRLEAQRKDLTRNWAG